jgi:hypothetical protein
MCGNSLKQVKLLIGLLTLCIYLAANVLAAPTDNIASFSLSNINNQNISDKVSYFSLTENTTNPPNQLNQLDTWLHTLTSHQNTNALSDKYAVAFKIYNDTQLSEWFVYPHGSVVQNIEILPKGEILKSSLILIEIFFLNLGGLRFVSSIGIRATENNREINIKGS